MKPNGEDCLPEWVRYGTRCFKLLTTPKTWINAEKECNAFIANLASIHNPWEHDFLYSLAKQTNQGIVWIGGSDAVKTSTWLWSDGSIFGGYTNWGSGEPNGSQERCMEMNSQGWNDQNCDDSRPFICGTRPFGPV
ncbi:ladderlectin-like [Scomber japonicus]|uniref:ladderlectin-like n=1 Tax=Scomber japonicus TaxID=13676 RepID=UPI00230659B1|nr:ladderlectin-like [Scomber japonicus]